MSAENPTECVVLKCKDSVTIKVDIDLLRNSCGHFEEYLDQNRINSDDTFEVEYTGRVMETVLHYLREGRKEKLPDFEVDQVIHLLSAAHKFGSLDLMEDIKEFLITHPDRCFASQEFLCSHVVEEVVLLKPIFSDSRFTGRLLLYKRISEWKRRMWLAGKERSYFSALDRDFYEKLIDKNILMYLERFYDPISYSRRFSVFSEDALEIFKRLQEKFGSDRNVPTRKVS